MAETITFVTQSKYFSAAFNAAIFDGPIRIYFAQYQEAMALKVYFTLQEKMREWLPTARQNLKDQGKNIFVMLYPTQETFDMSFMGAEMKPGIAAPVACERLGKDYVFGVCGPIEDRALTDLYQEVESVVGLGVA